MPSNSTPPGTGLRPGRPGWRTVLVAGLLLLAVGLTFSPVLRGGFVGLDDGNNIFLNPQLGVLTPAKVAEYFSDFTSARRYMPVGWLGFSAVFTWQGLVPAGYHAASLAWHMLATLGLFLAAYQIFRHGLATAAGAAPRRVVAAGLAAALWALHPLRTEAVAWASGLLYSQAAALAFLAVWLWTLRWSAIRRVGWYEAGAIFALGLSLLTYPLALGVPVVCWLLDRVCHPGNEATGTTKSWLDRFGLFPGHLVMAGLAATVLIATLVSRRSGGETFAGMPVLENFGFMERLVQALYVWTYDLGIFFFPLNLAPIYTTLYEFRPPSPVIYLAAGLGASVLVVVTILARRRPALVGWTVAYTAMALPVLGLTEHPWITHDRYTGLLHPVLAVAIFHGLLRGGAAWFFRVAAGLALVAILAAAVQARRLIGVWADPAAFSTRLEQTLPRNAWAGYYLGNVPASALFLAGQFKEIDPVFTRAEAFATGWSAGPARAEWAALLRRHRDFVQQAWPGRTVAPLAVLHYLHGKAAQERQDWRTARFHFQAAVRTESSFAEAGLEEAWCELEHNDPVAARRRVEQAIASPRGLSFSVRELSFWRLLAAVHGTRGELVLAAATQQRAREREAAPARP